MASEERVLRWQADGDGHKHRWIVGDDGCVDCGASWSAIYRPDNGERKASEPMPNGWDSNGTGEDTWRVEIEPDCFATDQPFVVSLWIEGHDGEEDFDALATPTPEQAREMAAALVFFADYVEKRNAGDA